MPNRQEEKRPAHDPNYNGNPTSGIPPFRLRQWAQVISAGSITKEDIDANAARGFYP
jgi:hypothetical protein